MTEMFGEAWSPMSVPDLAPDDDDDDSFLYFYVASGVWSYCEAQVFKGPYFYYFPFAKIVKYTDV